ncbi:hypothetical protein [Streptomyces sp. NBC_01707]|uniref:hypothetical protein n=1 Tax=Streptomyces sp. NBC_01707 TaxID=2975914 RepID=UPI00352EB3EA
MRRNTFEVESTGTRGPAHWKPELMARYPKTPKPMVNKRLHAYVQERLARRLMHDPNPATHPRVASASSRRSTGLSVDIH